MAEVSTPVELVPPPNAEQLPSKRSEEMEEASEGAIKARLSHVDSGALDGAVDVLTDEEGSRSSDSFFPADANVSDINVLDTGRSAEEVLSAEQLCLRRLDNIRQLKELYETELLNTLEEQRSRHCRSQNVLPGMDAADGATPDQAYRPLRALLAERAGAAPQAASAVESIQGAQADEEAAVPSLSEAEEAYTALPGGTADISHLQAERQRSRMRLSSVARLEQAASAGTARLLDKSGALAMLLSHKGRYLIRRSAVTLGRTTSTHGKVDVDLSPEQFAAKVSRQQGRLYLKSDGTFRLTNTGRRKFLVNNTQVKRGDTAILPHLSLVEIDNVRLLLMVNHLAVRRLLARSATFGDFPGN